MSHRWLVPLQSRTPHPKPSLCGLGGTAHSQSIARHQLQPAPTFQISPPTLPCMAEVERERECVCGGLAARALYLERSNLLGYPMPLRRTLHMYTAGVQYCTYQRNHDKQVGHFTASRNARTFALTLRGPPHSPSIALFCSWGG